MITFAPGGDVYIYMPTATVLMIILIEVSSMTVIIAVMSSAGLLSTLVSGYLAILCTHFNILLSCYLEDSLPVCLLYMKCVGVFFILKNSESSFAKNALFTIWYDKSIKTRGGHCMIRSLEIIANSLKDKGIPVFYKS